MAVFARTLATAVAILAPVAGCRAEGAADLVARFTAACMADASPYKSANEAAARGKLEPNRDLTGVDTPSRSHVVTTQTWHAGRMAGAELSLISTNVDSGRCRVQACGLVADRFPQAGIEAALTSRLKLAAPASRSDDAVALQVVWPVAAPPHQVVSILVQKALSGARVTLSVAQLCSQS